MLKKSLTKEAKSLQRWISDALASHIRPGRVSYIGCRMILCRWILNKQKSRKQSVQPLDKQHGRHYETETWRKRYSLLKCRVYQELQKRKQLPNNCIKVLVGWIGDATQKYSEDLEPSIDDSSGTKSRVKHAIRDEETQKLVALGLD